jgi:hypothetical protein
MFEAEEISGLVFEPALSDFLRPPFRKFEFVTAFSPTHAARILEEVVEPPRRWGWRTSSKRGFFEGTVAGSRFKINRVIRHSESFRPIIEGRFQRHGRGTTVVLTMRLAWIVMALWFGILVFLFWSCVSVDSTVAATFAARVALLAMTFVTYLVVSVCFAIEVRVAMKRLLELLRARQSDGASA